MSWKRRIFSKSNPGLTLTGCFARDGNQKKAVVLPRHGGAKPPPKNVFSPPTAAKQRKVAGGWFCRRRNASCNFDAFAPAKSHNLTFPINLLYYSRVATSIYSLNGGKRCFFVPQRDKKNTSPLFIEKIQMR